MADRFNRLDVSYDDKEWGNIIDPGEWNANFHEIENGFNALVDDLNSGILRPEDEENFTAVYGETTSAELEEAYDAGKKVFLIYEGIQFTMVRLGEASHIFFGFTMADGGDLTVISIRCTTNNWTNPLVGVYKTTNQNNNAFVPLTRTVNGKALSSNIILTPADVGAPTLSALATAIADWNARAIGLDEDIVDEASARQIADGILQTNIDNEASARQSGDRILQTNINNLETSLKNYTDNAIPKKVSELQNDSDYLTSETDPTVPAWAKQANKPSYTASEVGALPNTTVIPTKTSDLTNDSGFITDADIPEGSVASSTTPLMDGTADVGTELTFARGDHRHPTDTSRAPAVHTHGIGDVTGLQAELDGKADNGDIPDISGKLDKSGGTMTGKLILDGDPTSNLHAATKQYVDSGFVTNSDLRDKIFVVIEGVTTYSELYSVLYPQDDSPVPQLFFRDNRGGTYFILNVDKGAEYEINGEYFQELYLVYASIYIYDSNEERLYANSRFPLEIYYYLLRPDNTHVVIAYSSPYAFRYSPYLEGTPMASTPSVNDNSTRLATTAFVKTAVDNKITYGNTDLTAGTSSLTTGTFYAYYE